MKRERAFTFIELVVALTIFSIIAVSIYHTFRNGVRLWAETNSVIGDNQRLRVFFDAVSSNLRNVAAYSGIEAEWTSHKISFPTLADVSGDEGQYRDIARATYYFDDAKGEMKYSAAGKTKGFDEEKADEMVYMVDLESLDFEYPYKDESSEDGYIWKDRWEAEDKLPRGVKLRMKFNKKGESPQEVFEKIIFIPLGELGKEE